MSDRDNSQQSPKAVQRNLRSTRSLCVPGNLDSAEGVRLAIRKLASPSQIKHQSTSGKTRPGRPSEAHRNSEERPQAELNDSRQGALPRHRQSAAGGYGIRAVNCGWFNAR